MIRWLVSALLYLAANALALWIADLVLEDMSVTASGFIVAVLIFTGVEVLISPLLRVALILRGAVALIATFLGLLVTVIFTETIQIDGIDTWMLATVIVWLGGLIAGLILPLIFVKRAVADNPT